MTRLYVVKTCAVCPVLYFERRDEACTWHCGLTEKVVATATTWVAIAEIDFPHFPDHCPLQEAEEGMYLETADKDTI